MAATRLSISRLLTTSTMIVMACVCGLSQHHTDVRTLLQTADSLGLMSTKLPGVLQQLDSTGAQHGDLLAQYEARYRLGKYYLLKMNAADARAQLESAADLARDAGLYEKQGFALDRIGISYLREDKLDSALWSFQSSLKIYNEHELKSRLWTPLQGLSRIFQQKGDYISSLQYAERAFASIGERDDPVARTIVLNHILALTSEFNKFDDYNRHLNAYLATIDPLDLGTESVHIEAFFNANDPANRLENIERSIRELEPLGPSLSLLSAYYHLGALQIDQGNYSEARSTWLKGLEIDSDYPGIGYSIAFHNGIADASAAIGDYEAALSHTMRSHSLSDSLRTLANTQAIDELQVQFETERKEQIIQAQELELKGKARQQMAIIAIGIGILLLAAIVLLILRNRLKVQALLSGQRELAHRMEVQSLKQQNRLSAMQATISAQEEERKRIAYDLHDQLGGLLTSVKLQLQKFSETHELNGASSEFESIESGIDHACKELRNIAHNMMPHALLKMGLDAAIGDIVSTISASSGVAISYQNLAPEIALPQNLQINIYRIIAEAIQNAVKHGKANKIIVQLSEHEEGMTLVIEDDGAGFQKDAVEPGLGLRSIQSRVELMDGAYHLDTRPGEGTTMTIEFPVGAKAVNPPGS